MAIKEKLKKLKDRIKREAKVITADETKDRIFSSRKKFSSEETAQEAFETSKQRLFNINAWTEIPALLNSKFHLHLPNGERTNKKEPMIGEFISIQLPVPSPLNWVRIVDIKDEENFAEFTVSPSEDPSDQENPEKIAHFFHNFTSSTFKVELKGNTLYAYEIGKNEAVNSKGPEAGKRGLVNIALAEGGWLGFQKIQWKNLTDYLVNKAHK
ncbi:MAG: hypothetical protein ACK4ND_11315 [Cytophagaceae bacterium]